VCSSCVCSNVVCFLVCLLVCFFAGLLVCPVSLFCCAFAHFFVFVFYHRIEVTTTTTTTTAATTTATTTQPPPSNQQQTQHQQNNYTTTTLLHTQLLHTLQQQLYLFQSESPQAETTDKKINAYSDKRSAVLRISLPIFPNKQLSKQQVSIFTSSECSSCVCSNVVVV